MIVQTVIESPTFLADCLKAGISDEDRGMMVAAISNDPKQGDVIPGTGGARKLRFAKVSVPISLRLSGTSCAKN